MGYKFCDNLLRPENEDFYFGNYGFIAWYKDKYKPEDMSFWQDYFLTETNMDEIKALELYFEKLEEYYSWYKSLK